MKKFLTMLNTRQENKMKTVDTETGQGRNRTGYNSTFALWRVKWEYKQLCI